VVTTTTAPRCPACGAPVPAAPRGGLGPQPVFCGTDKCKQARARRAAERREAVALLRLVADLAAYAGAQVGNGLAPADARAAVREVARNLDAAAIRLRWLARPGPTERRRMVLTLSARGLSSAAIAARTGVSERTVYRYRADRKAP
jgi:DNA-binding NarL/FixJ family response regulator